MATIGLRVQDSPLGGNLSLADTLAKSIFGDPEGEMKARVMASQVGAHEAYRRKLLADAGLVDVKTLEEQHAEDERLRAGPLIGEAAATAVPMPIPVEASRADAPGTTGYGPQPGIVSPANKAKYDALVARERATGPIFARGNPNQVAEAIGKDYGGAILSGATINPAIVNPDSLRIAGGLYTGTAPSTSTVWSAGDTSGVDAEARGKILEERAKPVKPDIREIGGGLVRVDAEGNVATPVQGAAPVPKAPEHFKDAAGNDIQWDPATKTWIKAPGAAPELPKPVDIGPNAMLPPTKPGGAYTTVPTDRPAPEPGTPFSDSKATEGIALDTVLKTARKAAAGGNKVIGPDEARTYETAWMSQFGPQWDQKLDTKGVLRWVLTPGKPAPSSLPKPEVFLQPNGLQPSQQAPPPDQQQPQQVTGGATPAPTGGTVQTPPATSGPVVAAPTPVKGGDSAAAGGQVFPGDTPKSQLTDAQRKAQLFVPTLKIATDTLDQYNKDNLPNILELSYTAPSEELGTFGKLVEASPAISDNARRFGAAANQWTSAQLYDLSGAAIGKGEFDRSIRGFLPRPTDPQDLIDTKTKLRHAFLDAVSDQAYADDPAKKAAVLKLLAQGRAINLSGSGASSQSGGAPAPSGAPRRRVYDAQGNLQ